MALPAWRSKTVLAVALLCGVVVGLAVPVNALPGFSDHTGPSSLEISEFERQASGCGDDVTDFASGSIGDGAVSSVGDIRTETVDASLSTRVVRASPSGADLSTFLVHVDSHSTGPPANESCRARVGYHVELDVRSGSHGGLVPDAHGFRVVWYENGRYQGCSSSVTSPLNASCADFEDQRRVWSNATAG